ncbi:MAG: hypothetical protein ACXWBQ_14820, partial [Usitatibacter sp.]
FPVATHENGEKLSKQTLAVAADDREAAALLGAALRVLGQADASPGAAPREILALAARRWAPAAFPRRRAAVAPAGARPGV